MFKSQDEIEALDRKIEEFSDGGKFDLARNAYFIAARYGSFRACQMLAVAFHPEGGIYPQQIQDLIRKSKRRSNRYSNRELKCLRRAAANGNFHAMFGLYNANHFGHPRLIRKSRHKLAEYWLKRAAESGEEIPCRELNVHLRYRDRG